MAEPIIEEVNNNKKCYSCGKIFKLATDLQRHKNRKTPCLIRAVPEDQIANPNRCIFCNKILSKKEHLTRHYNNCKIKNGGMEILADKVRYEQEIRILKQKDNEKDQQIQELKARMEQMEKQIATQANNVTITNNTNNITININNYMKPNYDFLIDRDDPKASLFCELFRTKRINTPMELVPLLWFNPAHPENLSIYLVNKSTNEVLAYNGNKWTHDNSDNVTAAIRARAYEITENLAGELSSQIPTGRQFTDSDHELITTRLKNNRDDEEVIKIELEKVYNQVLQHRELVKPLTR